MDKFYSFENIDYVNEKKLKNIYLYEWVGYNYIYSLKNYINDSNKIDKYLSKIKELKLTTIRYYNNKFEIINKKDPGMILLNNNIDEDELSDDIIIIDLDINKKTITFDILLDDEN